MQVTELESQGLQKSFKVVVEAARIAQQVEVELRNAGEKVKIPGFRPGLIPIKVLRQRYGKSIQADVLKQVINEATGELLQQRKLRPAMAPAINIEDYKDEGDLTFTVACEVFPVVPDIAFDKLKLDRKQFEIADADVDKAAKTIAERSPRLVRAPAGEKATLGSVTTIDFKGTVGGVAFDGGAANDFRLELGSGQFIPGFEDQMVGMKEGETRTVTVDFPKDYPSKDLAGKEAAFEVTVKELNTKETPEMDEAFAKDHGFNDVPALRDAIRNQLTREYDSIVRGQLKKQLFDVLEEAYDFELPKSMVEMEFNTIWERLQQSGMAGDGSFEGKNEEELKEEYGSIARRRVKLGLMLADIGQRNNIQISREEMTRAMMQQASQFPGQEQKVLEFYRKSPERMDDLRGPILEEKAVDHILAKVSYNDTRVALDELNVQDDEEEADGEQKKKSAKKPAKAAESEEKPKAAKKKAGGNKE